MPLHHSIPSAPSFARVVIAGCAMLLASVLGGCGRSEGPTRRDAGDATSAERPLRVVATVGMLGDMAKAVGGPDAEVTVLMGPGTDPHLYKPTPGDMRILREADVIMGVGLRLEGKMADVLRDLGRARPVVLVGESLRDAGTADGLGAQARGLIPSSEEGKEFDPHIWFDVALWARCVPAVEEAFAAARPSRADAFRTRGQDKRQALAQLDAFVRESLTTIPPQRRVLVTAHDAFAYFGRAYGLEVMGVQGISTESEASLKDINHLVDMLSERSIPAVFIESSVNPRTIEALVQGAKARGHTVAIGGQLYSDAMGDAATPEGTYEGMVRHNVRVIVEALR